MIHAKESPYFLRIIKQVHTRLFYNKLKCQILELFKTEYYIDEMSVQKYPSLVVMSDFARMDFGEISI